VAVAFSAAIYGLRFEKDNGTNELAVRVLNNFGD